MVLLDRLRRNDKTYTELVFYETDFLKTDNFLDLVTAILTNTSIQTVRFHDCGQPKWSTKQLQLLFASIARLPNLTILSVSRTTLSLQALTILLRKATPLRELDIWGSELLGTERDAVDLGEALSLHSELEAMYLKRVTFHSSVTCLDPLLVANQARMDRLLWDEVRWANGAISRDSLAMLLRSSGLSQLRLENLHLDEHHFYALAKGLTKSCLRDLHLGHMEILDTVASSFAQAMVSNESLKRLVLFKCSLGNQAVSEIAKMLKVNTTLEQVDLSENQFGDGGAVELANAVLMSSSIKRLELYGNANIGEKGVQVLMQLAEQNYVLEALNLFCLARKSTSYEQIEIQKKINSYMKLNDDGTTRRSSGKWPKVWYE